MLKQLLEGKKKNYSIQRELFDCIHAHTSCRRHTYDAHIIILHDCSQRTCEYEYKICQFIEVCCNIPHRIMWPLF